MTRAPEGEVTRPAKPIPVWLRLRWEGGAERAVKGFAMAWVRDVVPVQYLGERSYHLTAREIRSEALERDSARPQFVGSLNGSKVSGAHAPDLVAPRREASSALRLPR